MKKIKGYENYPASTVTAAFLLEAATCVIGAYIMSLTGAVWMALYMFYIILLEVLLLKNGCANCYYYGKTCFSGKGRLAPLFFRKGSTKKFACREMTPKDLIPDLLVFLIPAITGIVLLFIHFSIIVLILVLILFALSSFGNGFVRGNLACPFCKQRNIGCPAERLFGKTKR